VSCPLDLAGDDPGVWVTRQILCVPVVELEVERSHAPLWLFFPAAPLSATFTTMSMRVIGAGLPRTGTTSLKSSLETLLDGRCYHMTEFGPRSEDHGPLFWSALEGDLDALDHVLDGWDAAVDWPASIFWRELAERHPEALVILSTRASPGEWWRSANATVWESMRRETKPMFMAWNDKMRRGAGFGDDWDDQAVAQARYQTHIDDVVASIAPERLIIWEASQGWAPLAEHLGVPVPSQEPVRHLNTSAEFRAHHDWDR